jgi:cyclopropane fatty-acyl-phospholipid synthase-like methyltransferase
MHVLRAGETLMQSQLNKLDAIIQAADLQPGDHVLEIGCGWGGLAIRAAQTVGCRWTGLTISKEQLAEANARVAALGLQDKVNLIFCDYRDAPNPGTYDKVGPCTQPSTASNGCCAAQTTKG